MQKDNVYWEKEHRKSEARERLGLIAFVVVALTVISVTATLMFYAPLVLAAVVVVGFAALAIYNFGILREWW